MLREMRWEHRAVPLTLNWLAAVQQKQQQLLY
jgi:hypothetical protein